MGVGGGEKGDVGVSIEQGERRSGIRWEQPRDEVSDRGKHEGVEGTVGALGAKLASGFCTPLRWVPLMCFGC